MITGITHSRVFVNDQDEARDFYVDKLGLEVSADVDLEVMRWLTVRVPGGDHNILLEKADAGFRDEGSAEIIQDLMSKGDASMFILGTSDCRATFDDLKAKGVEIVEEPTDRFYGIDCAVRDPFGNQIRITQEKEIDNDLLAAKATPDAKHIIE
jgi:catechol 2,3-dioxygenase-like lactoylglutathione lyase family enzyme